MNTKENKNNDFELKCYKCKASLPFLHPHIMVERYDDDDNIICEECYEKLIALKATSK